MSTLAASSTSPPLAENQLQRVSQAVAGMTPVQLQWVSGYIAGLGASATIPASAPETGKRLTILYGSQTGNSERIAAALAKRTSDSGFPTAVHSLADYRPASLKRESLVVLLISTHGEGDPPDDAELFHEFLLSSRAPRLTGLGYAVLALGDTAYVNFCQTGRELDARLDELGAQRVLPIVECDLDYDEAASSWSDGIVAGLPEWLGVAPVAPRLHAVETATRHGKDNPFVAPVLLNQKITGGKSTKDVRHVELSLEGSGLSYEPGDSLAVVARNPRQLVAEFLDILGADEKDEVLVGKVAVTLADALTNRLEITACNQGFLRAWHDLSGASELGKLLEDGHQEALVEFLHNHQVIDVVRQFPVAIDAQHFVSLLRKLSPRSYSIASGPSANPGEVHLTVGVVHYAAFGHEHWGAASTHIADRVDEGDTLSVFVEPNSRFRLPSDGNTDIIMIGAGTGVAPFRAFVEERMEQGARGRNWLFFGDRTFSDDFLYQLEWQRHLKHGGLHRLDVAFSRDQDNKIYVQDRIRERSAEIFDWLEGGAAIYVCGDAKRMAGDVDDALIDVIAQHAQVDRATAQARLAELRRKGRYRRDVY